MNDWMDEFISQCLASVPFGKYRRRAEKELRDHMAELRQSMTEAEVLQTMGDPEQLRDEYKTAWERTPLGRVCRTALGVIAVWCLIFLSMYLAAFFMTVFFPFSGSLLSHGLASGIVLFLIPFSLGAVLLRACFRREHHRAWWVTLVLLISWASFNWFWIRIMIGFAELDQYYEQADWIPLLLTRYPWLTPYLWSSFAGCLLLGALFGTRQEGRQELA